MENFLVIGGTGVMGTAAIKARQAERMLAVGTPLDEGFGGSGVWALATVAVGKPWLAP